MADKGWNGYPQSIPEVTAEVGLCIICRRRRRRRRRQQRRIRQRLREDCEQYTHRCTPSILSDEASLGHTTLSPSVFGRPLCPKFKTTNESAIQRHLKNHTENTVHFHVEHATAVFRVLPLLFPSSTAPPKKLGASREALFHVLTTSEDPYCLLRQRPLSCPFVLLSEDNCMIAVGSTPVTTFDREDLCEGLLYIMAYYYAFHLTYPKCISTLLSVLQTEILQDSIHDQDLAPSYKKALAEWKSFIG
ncbi:uncharacterized protein LOC126388390 isoform X2 [Epinephelus moara]|uniref:uncharacterized protein LOC126388390 isoform X2 n=1 Tax=Epinephelus moara TaxID=300413 RepID=UPI00214EB461|nr:uncharacterized protein LOC126388390 isoform X2 [Epinephelus moara]